MKIPVSTNIISSELAEFEKAFKEDVKSQTPLLDRVLQYIISKKGKQLRPRFVLLTAKMFGPISPITYRAASLVELLHTATLVHDDVVDDSMERRGVFSINALWKNKIAVLVGDYLLTKGMLLSLKNDDFTILKLMSDAIRKMVEGELLQLEKSRKLNLKEEIYFEIITNKTASLLASACAAGAWSTTEDAEITEKARLFGEKVGIAFQIKDDLFDYGTDDVGKPTGNDIQEKKMTLPIIYTLNKVDASTRRLIINTVKNDNRNKEKVADVVRLVQQAGGIEYASKKMMEYRDVAIKILHEFPENEARAALDDLVRYTTDRAY